MAVEHSRLPRAWGRRGYAAVLFAAAVSLHADIAYRLSAEPPAVRVSITLPSPLTAPGAFVMPRAIPMGYGESPFDRFVEDFRAFDAGGSALPVTRQEGPRWRVPRESQRFEYRIDLARQERETLEASDSSRSRPGYLFVLGYSVFGFIEGFQDQPATLDIKAPADWPVFSTLAPGLAPGPQPGPARAPNFYALADSQVMMGPRLRVARVEREPALWVTAYLEGPVDFDRQVRLATEAYDAMLEYFGDAPFPHYTAHLDVLKPLSDLHRYNFSMEHMDSSTYTLLEERAAAADAAVRYNFAHHIGHAWIPKRSYGAGYFPFSWELAPLLETIWLSEGWGQYAAMVAVAGRLPPERQAAERDRLLSARFRTALPEMPAFLLEMPLRELSRVASTRYSLDFRTGRTVFSRGGLMAAEIDDLIRARTAGRKSLRDGLRAMVAWTARHQRAFTVEELAGILRTATGVDSSGIIRRWLGPYRLPEK